MTSRQVLSPRGEGRVLFAFFLQPLVAAAITFAMFPIIHYLSRAAEGGYSVDYSDAAASVAMGAALAAVFIVPLGAAPLLVWMLRRGPVTLKHTLLAGAALANVPFLLIVLTGGTSRAPGAFGPLNLFRAIVIPAIVGAASAFVFWLMTRDTIGAPPSS